jgi:hypothetical protein
MAAIPATHPAGRPGASHFFNGKLDRPRLVASALSLADSAALGWDALPHERNTSVVAAWDFSREIGGVTVTDAGPNGLHGRVVNLPSRAVKGFNWSGTEQNWRHAPEEYGAIHFHDDDLYDCGWETDFFWTVPEGTRSGFYATRLTTDDDESWVSFFVRPKQGRSTAPVAFVASTATFMAYANTHHRMDCDHIEHLYEGLLTFGETEVFLGEHRELGGSHYDTHSDGSGVFYSSRLRPILNMRPGLYTFNFINDSYVCAWLESLNQAYDVITDEDIEAEGVALLNQYTAVITGSHSTSRLAGAICTSAAMASTGGSLITRNFLASSRTGAAMPASAPGRVNQGKITYPSLASPAAYGGPRDGRPRPSLESASRHACSTNAPTTNAPTRVMIRAWLSSSRVSPIARVSATSVSGAAGRPDSKWTG